MCCDPCKCQVCDRRNNGTKSMLKPVPNGTTSFRPSSSQMRTLMLDTSFQGPSNPGRSAVSQNRPDNTTGQWEAYASGGAQADDAKVLQKRREQEAQFLESLRNATPPARSPSEISSAFTKLVQVSPEKTASSRNTKLLLDLDEGTEGQPRQQGLYTEALSYANAASSKVKGKGKADFNLLD